jgi:hypothetical protein
MADELLFRVEGAKAIQAVPVTLEQAGLRGTWHLASNGGSKLCFVLDCVEVHDCP